MTPLSEITDLIRAEGGVPGEWRGECRCIMSMQGCPLHDQRDGVLMVVGEAPGPEEAKKGRPFIGKAGQLLDGMMKEAGIPAFYITNVSKTFPGYDKHGKIAKPTKEDKERWQPMLDAEIEAVRPRKVLLLGQHACKLAFPGTWKMAKIVGTKVEQAKECEKCQGTGARHVAGEPTQELCGECSGEGVTSSGGITYYAAYHPAGFLYNQGTAANTRNMNKQRRVLADVKGEESTEYEYIVLEPNRVDGLRFIDVETAGGTDVRLAEITEWSSLDEHGDSATLCFDADSRPVRPAIPVFHNAMFDYPLLVRGNSRWLEDVEEIHDTMVMAYTLGYEDLSLKGLCNQLFGVKVYDYENRHECGKETYNAQDVFLTRRLYEYLLPMIGGTAYDIDRSIIKLLTYASLFSGYEIDQKRLGQAIVDTEQELYQLEETFTGWYPGINMSSPAQLLTVLPTKDTTAETLKELDTAEAHVLLRWRGLKKDKTTYLYPYREKEKMSGLYRLTLAAGDHGDETGGTRTGRLSSHSPNMQNLDPVIQRCLRAPAKHDLLRADYSQIELRCIAEITQDPTLVSSLLEGRDFHEETVGVLGLTGPDARRIAKVWNFGRFYGAEAPYLSTVVGKSIPETEKLLELHAAFCPGFNEWVDYHFAQVQATGYSEAPAPFRHRRKIHLFDKRKARKEALNHPIQSHAVYITKAAMAEIGYVPGELEFVNQVHDDIHYIVPKGDKKKAAMVKEAMIEVGNKYLPTVGIDVDIKLGRYWE